MGDSTFHALLIGVDFYFANVLASGAEYRSLHGCVGDVSRLEEVLRARLSGHDLVVTKLLAPHGEAGHPAGDESSWPTAANIRAALAALADRAQPGDQVLIHYSGHGGRVVTTAKALKGGDGIDEALVPTDIGVPDVPGRPPRTRPERYIRDVELALYLDRLAGKTDATGTKGVVITLFFDCCHAGGCTRGTAIATRCATGGAPTTGDPHGTLDRRELSAEDLPFDPRELSAAYERLRATARAGADRSEVSWLPPARGYVLLAACRDVESAIEASIDGRPRGGVLTDALIEAIGAIGADQSWKTIYDRVLARVHGRFPSQTPQLVGEIDRHVFGTELRPAEPTIAVAGVDAHARTVRLSAGLASTIARDTKIGIYRPGEQDFSAPRRVAVATIVEVGDLDAVASLDPAAAPETIEVGAPAVIESLALRRRVELLHRTDLPPDRAHDQDAALAAVAAAVAAERGFLELCAPGETPHYQVVVTPEGHYEICDPTGVPYRDLEPLSAVGSHEGVRSLIAKLRRLGHCHRVLELAAPPSALLEPLEVELLAAPPGWDGSTQLPSPTGGTPLERSAAGYRVPSGTWVWLRITNQEPTRPVNVALLAIDRKWNVDLIVPDEAMLHGKKYETIAEPGRTFAFRMLAPIPETLDVLKLFVTVGDVDFRWLATTTGGPRGASKGLAGESSLGLLVEAIADGEAQTRDHATTRAAHAPWTVIDLRIRTFQP